jgi:cytidylate kinase
MAHTPSSLGYHGAADDIVCIDGPAASGKSSAARALSRKLGWYNVSSGLLYRLVAATLLKESVDYTDEKALSRYVMQMEISLVDVNLDCVPRATLVSESEDLKAYAVTQLVSTVAATPIVRQRITEVLREYSTGRKLVVEGRDIGTEVFPHSRYKFFLDADLGVRKRRRQRQRLLDDVERRDAIDKSRTVSPLRIPWDATIINTSGMSIEQVVEEILTRLYGGALAGHSHC